MKNYGGWTLLETIICIALSATIAWAAIPKVSASALKTDVKLFAEVLRGIRHRAIVERREYEVSIQSGTCSVFPHQAGLVGLCKHLRTHSPESIRFYANGVASPKTVSFIHDDTVCNVSIAQRGRIRVTCNELGVR